VEAVDLVSQTGLPGDLPPSPQSVFQAFFILNTSRDLGGWVTIQARLGFEAARAQRMAPEKFSTHVSISIQLSKSAMSGILAYR
jgi:hypothetical protein